MKSLLRRLQYLFARRQRESELDEEIRDHLARKAADLGDTGAARRQFGNVTLVQEESRAQWSFPLLEQLAQDVRYAVRDMAAHRMFTAVAVLSLALGIGANTAIYSFMDAVMLRALPVSQPEQLVILNWRAKDNPRVVASHWGEIYDHDAGGVISPNFPYPAYELLRNNQVFSSLFGHMNAGSLNVVAEGQAEIARGQYVTGDLFTGLGVPPALGRLIGRTDDQRGAPPVAVLTYDYWKSRFGANPAVVGQTVRIDSTAFTVIGVAAPNFYGVNSSVKPQLFLPIVSIEQIGWQNSKQGLLANRTFYWIELMARLRPGVTLETAQAHLAGPFHNFVYNTAVTELERSNIPALSLQEGGSGVDAMRREYAKPLWVLMAMVGLILLIACANLANLLLARAAGRRREMAVRLSLGAGRFRVIRQLLTESLLLAIAGAVAGLGVAALAIRAILALLANGDEAFPAVVGLDWRVLTFTLLMAIAASLLFGLVPAIQSTRLDLTPALKETRAGAPRRRNWFSLSQALVVSQIAIALLLVVAASLFVRSLSNLYAVQLGFNAERLLTFSVNAAKAGYEGPARTRFFADLESRLAAVPGVRATTSSDMPIVGGWMSSTVIRLPGAPPPREGQPRTGSPYAQVGPTFFETMEIPILQGRALDERDTEGARKVAVVNQVFAQKFFPGQNPVGQHFSFGGAKPVEIEIVGVARNARYNSLKREIPTVMYLPWKQTSQPLPQMFFDLRAAGDPLALASAVREVVRQANPLVPVAGLTTQTRRMDQTIRQERTFAQLSTWFGALALLMASIGLYGTLAYGVARRTSEIGIRMALGARQGRIVWMVLRDVLVLAGVGLAIGLAAAYQAAALLESFLFGLKPHDPFAILVSAAVLLGCALLAGFLPARRAARVDPLVALRHD
ncbi:MAG: ABC transporter permease [Bryobacteraceae bacterium]|nr:ABC transporter permease [Bryobacteraceae bacterium]